MARLVSGRVGVASTGGLDPNRTEYLTLSQAEPNLGNPPVDVGYLLTSDTHGSRSWTLGLQGPQGIQGITGIQGPQGLQGIQGIQGMQGIQGIQGIQGVQGIQGIQGMQGTTGIQGETGLQGIQGTDGVQGTDGIQGSDGTSIQIIGIATDVQALYPDPTTGPNGPNDPDGYLNYFFPGSSAGNGVINNADGHLWVSDGGSPADWSDVGQIREITRFTRYSRKSWSSGYSRNTRYPRHSRYKWTSRYYGCSRYSRC